VNPACARLLGASTPEQLIGMQAVDIVVPEQRDVVRQRIAIQVEKGRRVPVMEQQYMRLDGGIVDVEVNSAPVAYAGKSGVQVFARDITARKRNEAALRESAEQYRRLFENMFEGYTRCRLIYENGVPIDIEYLEVNRAFHTLTGLHEVVGRRVSDLIPGLLSERAEVLQHFHRMLRSREPVRFEVYVKPIGKWIANSAYPLDGDEFVTMFDDVTARKRFAEEIQELNRTLELRVKERTEQLAAKERELKSIVDAIPGIVGYWDETQMNRFANRIYESWMDVEQGGLYGRTLRSVVGDKVYDEVREHVEGALKGQPQSFELARHLPGIGAVKHLLVQYIPDIEDGKVKGFLSLGFDVTKLKEAEEAAAAANQAKSDFVASISHEIRTPLNAVLGFAQLGEADDSGRHAQMRFRRILESGQHLLALINDILDFSKIEAGKLELIDEVVDLATLVDDTTAMLAQRAEAKGLRFLIVEHASLPRAVRGDSMRVRQILLNLLSNAVKFTSQGSVLIELTRQAGTLVVHVRDTGIGIETAHLERLFRPFEQADTSTTRRFGGTGLGLSITRRLVELMGGVLTVQSIQGKGSTFTVALPLVVAEEAKWDLLGTVHLAGMHENRFKEWQSALRERGVQAVEGMPVSAEARTTLVLSPHAYVQHQAALDRLASHGKVICVIPVGATDVPELRPKWDGHVVPIHGPLSPLRLLGAVETHLRIAGKQAAGRRLDGLRVLAADDNEINRVILQEMLEDAGARVTFAVDGEDAVRAVEHAEQPFDVILCDIEMPKMDGYQAARSMRALSPRTPIIGLTAHAFAEARERAREAGMVGYLTKPFAVDDLISAVAEARLRQDALDADIEASVPSGKRDLN